MRKRSVAAALLAGITFEAAAAERPAFQRLRYEENWGPLADPAAERDALDRLKWIRLDDSGRSTLTLGGEWRSRLEHVRRPQWGALPVNSDTVFLQRWSMFADARFDGWRTFVQFYAGLEAGRFGPPQSNDRNRLDLHQAFLDVPLLSAGRLVARVGRQELLFGSSRLVDVREGPNVRRNFLAARLIWRTAGWRIDGFAARPTRTRIGTFDDVTESTQALWGVYGVAPADVVPIGRLDLYYLGHRNERARYVQGTAKETRHTFGARFWGAHRGWEWNIEPMLQTGRFGSNRIRAWTVATDLAYTFKDAPLSPRFALLAAIASGDKSPQSGGLQSFNALYPRGNYFSETTLLGPRNFFNIHPFVTLRLTPSVSLTSDVDFFWRLERGDGIYNPGGGLLRAGNNTRERYVGTEISSTLAWTMNDRVAFTAIYARFVAGAFLKESGPGRDIDFVELTLRAQF